jgi:hypothetical protein
MKDRVKNTYALSMQVLQALKKWDKFVFKRDVPLDINAAATSNNTADKGKSKDSRDTRPFHKVTFPLRSV